MERKLSKPLGSPPHTDMGSYHYSGPPTDLADTVCLPIDRKGELGVQSCQQQSGPTKFVQLMWKIPIPQGQPMVPWTVRPNYWPSCYLGPKIPM